MFAGFTAPVDQSEQRSVIASPDQVRGFSTRNPGILWHWIPDRVRDDALLLREHSINSCAGHHLEKFQ
jgi:hypothetical protein